MHLSSKLMPALALAAAAAMVFPGPGRRRLEAVQGVLGLPVGRPVHEPAPALVRAYLRRTRRGRAAGVLLAALWLTFLQAVWFAIGVVADTVVGPFAPHAVAVLLVGYLAGSGLSEVTWRMPDVGQRRGAELSVRDLTRYLPRWVPLLQRLFAVLAVVLLGVLVLLLRLGAVPQGALVRSPAWGLVLAALIAGTAIAAELGQRRILARPQSWPDADLARVDDAIRAWSQRNLAAAALAVQLLLLTQLAVQVAVRASDLAGHQSMAHRFETPAYLAVPLVLAVLIWHRLSSLPLATLSTARRSASTGVVDAGPRSAR